MRVVLEPGSLIFDTAGKPDYEAARRAGYVGASLYPTNKWRATQTMVDDCLGAGLVIQWNQEAVGNEWTQGYNGGKRMVEQAIPAIQAFGWKLNETPIVYSLTDTGVPAISMGLAREAYRACWEASWAGGYGPLNVCYDLSVNAPSNFVIWHWGGDYTGWPPVYQDWSYVHCQQVYPPRSGFGVSYDHNYLLKPLTMWAGPGDDPPKPKDEDDTVFTLFTLSDSDAVFAGFFDGTQAHIVTHCSPSDAAHYRADHVPERTSSIAGLAYCTFAGDLSELDNDSRHNWTGSEFRRIIGNIDNTNTVPPHSHNVIGTAT